MKAIGLICSVILWAGAASAMSFWTALAEIESGGNDYVVGNVGEISRYQIRPEVWQAYSSSRRYTDPAVALPIAEKYMAKLKRDFERATGRAATESDCVILWKSGIAGYEKRGFNSTRMSAAHQDRIIRFRNLRDEGLMLAHGSEPKSVAPAAAPLATKPVEPSVLETFFLQPVETSEGALAIFGKSGAVTHPAMTGGLFTEVEAPSKTAPGLTPCLQ
jgi:hypothetical protein